MTQKRQRRILILDCNTEFTSKLQKDLSAFGYDTMVVEDGAVFFSVLQQYNPDVILLNLILEDKKVGGIDVFRMMLYEADYKTRIIQYSYIERSSWLSEVYRLNNFYIYSRASRFSLNGLIKLLNSNLQIDKQEEDALTALNSNYIRKRDIIYSHPFIGEAESTRLSRHKIAKLAKADEDMFIIGETGTGKEVAAYYYYINSVRFGKPINIVNCSALTETLIESELYGHVKGSFTSAERNKLGLFEICDKGVLFLDEITNMSINAQSKLLRSIENKEIQVVGGEAKKVDTRLIFASNASLDVLSRPDVIRRDLFYRIESNIVELLPLRERKEDIILLMNHFLSRYSTPGITIDYNSAAEVRDILYSYPWFGNIRELKNFCKSLLINEKEITPKIIKQNMEIKIKKQYQSNTQSVQSYEKYPDWKQSMADYEKNYLQYHLNLNQWHINETAKKIGIERTTLYKKIKSYNLKHLKSL